MNSGGEDSRGCLLFDFDGTLARTAADMTAALNAMLLERGRPPADLSAAALRVSGGARALLEFGGFDADGAEMTAARGEFLRRYEETGYRRTDLFPGISAALAELEAEGWLWGVMTNKPRRYFSPLAERLGWEGKPGLVAGDDCARAKPHPDGLYRAAELCGIEAGRCLYVGDDPRDARAANAAEMPFILAAWGYWNRSSWPRSAPVSAVAATPADLLPLARMLIPE